MRVGIAGIGGIGSNVARLLAQAGVEKIRLVDFDRVEISNLNRQFFRACQAQCLKTESLRQNLLEISPRMDVRLSNEKIVPDRAPDIFSDCAILVEGFDLKESKKKLVEAWVKTSKPLICASGIAGRAMETIKVRQVGSCHVVGDFESDQDREGLFPPKVSLVASIMAAIVLDLMERMKDE